MLIRAIFAMHVLQVLFPCCSLQFPFGHHAIASGTLPWSLSHKQSWCPQGWYRLGPTCVRRTSDYYAYGDIIKACGDQGGVPWSPDLGQSSNTQGVQESLAHFQDLSSIWIPTADDRTTWLRRDYTDPADVSKYIDREISRDTVSQGEMEPSADKAKDYAVVYRTEYDMMGKSPGMGYQLIEETRLPVMCMINTLDHDCKPCPAGQWLDGTTCKQCPAGRMSTEGSYSEESCEPCAANRYADFERGECEICPRGRYSVGGATGILDEVCLTCPGNDEPFTQRGMVSASQVPGFVPEDTSKPNVSASYCWMTASDDSHSPAARNVWQVLLPTSAGYLCADQTGALRTVVSRNGTSG